MPRPRRSFPAELKAQVVLQRLTGAATQAELCRKHNIKPQLLSHWKDAVVERMHVLFDLNDETTLLHVRVAELEQIVGRQALEIEIPIKASRTNNAAEQALRHAVIWRKLCVELATAMQPMPFIVTHRARGFKVGGSGGGVSACACV